MSKSHDKKIGAVLVQGGGIAGVQASLDLANSGFKVYLVERDAAIGGMMAHLDKTEHRDPDTFRAGGAGR
jgi:heterodisulfide reductase subunit A-like polyferredoxin